MEPIEIIAQIIGVFAMAFNIGSYQQKQQKYIIALQLIGSTLFTIHFFMLNAYMGAILNAVGILRAVVFLKEDFFHSKHFLWIFIPVLLAIPILIWIEPYRLSRLSAFLNPWENPRGEGYQLIQSLYALGGGGWFGTGVFQSRQKYLFLPIIFLT